MIPRNRLLAKTSRADMNMSWSRAKEEGKVACCSVKNRSSIERIRLCCLAFAFALALPAMASAASLTWGASGGGGAGTWDVNTTANWFNGSAAVKWPVAGGTNDDAVFAGTAGTVGLAPGGVTANDLAFNAAGYTIQNNTLTLDGTTPTITTTSGTATIASVVAGAAGLTKAGGGTLVLPGSNSFTGNVTVSAGTLKIAHSNALGSGAKTLSMQGVGRVLQLSNNITLGSTIGLVVSTNTFDGGGISNVDGDNEIAGSITFSTGNPALNISCSGGSLNISGNVTLTTSSRTLYLGGASTSASLVSGVIGQSGTNVLSVVKQGAGTWVLTRANTYSGPTTISSGKLTGLVGGGCASSAVTLAASSSNSATLGVLVTNITKQWTCASLAVNNGGTGSDLEFNFSTLKPSTSLAPLKITGTAAFTTTPSITIIADSNLGPVGTKFPLITWGSVSGTIPSSFSIATSNPTTAHLEVTGNTLYLVIDDYTPTLSDTQLFSALNLDYPGLETVKAQAQAGDFTAAKTALATYLRTRTNVNWYFDWHNPTTSVSYDQPTADTNIAGTFSFGGYTHTFPNGDIDWLYTPNPSSQWVSLINRMNFWPNIGATYWGTANESYALAWARQFRSWVTQCPAPSTTQSILSSWATIQAAERMRWGWPDTFFRCVLSPSVSNEDLVIYLKSCIENGRYLRQYSIGAAMNFNIDAWELSGIYTTATVFPELNEAAEWRSYAVQQMYAQQALQFYPDGVHIELSPRYHIGTLSFVDDIYELAALNGRLSDLPADYITRTEKAFEFLLYNSAPTRLMPPFNDCGSANENTRDYLVRGYSYFPNRTDFLWTSGGGTKPAKTSWVFPYAGYAAMRSGWETTANFLCFDAGPLGASSHRHEDKLNVVLWAWGRELLFDSGGGSYESSIWRTWGTSSYSHNCITVDGLDQEGGDGGYAATDADYQAQGAQTLRWESGAAHDFAAGIYNRGYGGSYNNRPASQTRRVLFVKPDIYLVADTMVPGNTSSHTYQARWHLTSTNTVLDAGTKTVATTDAGKANLAVVPCLGTGLTVAAVSGQVAASGTTPVLSQMLGWDQPDLSITSIRPATTVTQTLTGTGTKQFLTLFLPLKSGQANPVASITPTGTTSAQVTLTDGRQLNVYADPDPTRGLKLTEILASGSTGRQVGAGYLSPVIAGLSNRTAAPGATVGPLPFTVTDNSPIANVTLSVRSLNQALIPDANLALGGSGTSRTITATVLPEKSGIATIVVSALDPDGSTTSESFDIAVSYPTSSPPVALMGSGTTTRNTSVDIDLRSLVSDVETPTAHLFFKVQIAQSGTVTLLSNGYTARFTPTTNFTGSALFDYTVTDLGNDSRIYAQYSFDPPDDLSTGSVIDASMNNRTAEVGTVGTGAAQLSSDVPAALAGYNSQSIQLTEAGDYNGARLRRTISEYDLDLNDHDWTFACWFKRTATATANDDFIFHLGSGNGYGAEEELQLYGQSGTSKVGLSHWNGRSNDISLTSGSVAPTGQWCHAAVVYKRVSANHGNVTLYVNGTFVGTANNIPFNFNPANPVNIGGHAYTTANVTRWFNGLLDEVAIFESALMESEISTLAKQPVARVGGLTTTNSVNVTVGPLTGLQQWRLTWFGTANNTGTAADSADPNKDGESNFLEFATGQNPNAATLNPGTLVKSGTNLEFTYTRNKAAIADGVTFAVEWSGTLGNDWSTFGVAQAMVPGSDNGTIQLWKATVPAGSGPKRFVRLRVTK